jgi:hypothetical protein
VSELDILLLELSTLEIESTGASLDIEAFI